MIAAFEVVAHPPPQDGEEIHAYDSKGRKRKVRVMEVMPGPGKKYIVKGDDGKVYTTASSYDVGGDAQ